MGVFNEEAHTFEDVARRQLQIYMDAADYGMPYRRSKPPEVIKALIESVNQFQALDAAYPHEKPFIRKRISWKGGVTVTIRIGWEIDEGMECGSQYTISYCKIGTRHGLLFPDCDTFISVDVEHYREPAKN
jgi:hypothetical protein